MILQRCVSVKPSIKTAPDQYAQHLVRYHHPWYAPYFVSSYKLLTVFPQTMDVFIDNIPGHVDKLDLLVELHRIIHRPPFITEPPINFDIFLTKPQNNGRRTTKKIGFLTLPTEEVGQLFLMVYPSTPIRIQSSTLVCKKANRPPRETTLARVREEAWQDPEIIKSEKRREEQASIPTRDLEMSFGHLRRDGTFTTEHSFRASIYCDPMRRRLVIGITSQGSETIEGFMALLALYTSSPTFSYPSSSVRAVVRSQTCELFLEFSVAATFEKPPAAIDGKTGLSQRLLGLPDCRSVPLGSQTLRVVFPSTTVLQQFTSRTRSIQLPLAKFKDINVIDAPVYSTHSFDLLSRFMQRLPFALSFQLEKAVWDGIVEPGELCEQNMQSAILKIQRDHPDSAAAIFRFFVSTLRVPTFRDPPKPPRRKPEPPEESLSKSAKKRRRRKNRNRRRELVTLGSTGQNLHGQLLEAADAYEEDAQMPRRRYDSTPDPALYEAYHLSVTPSSQVLEGPLPDLSNTVLRLYQDYHDCFLRVSFQDEDGGKPRREPNLAIDELLNKRYKPVLLNGVTVAGRPFEFLGYSMSSLKDYTFVFVTPFDFNGAQMNADEIRKRFGNIPKASNRPALLAARWGQMFSASMPSVPLLKSQLREIPDRTAPGDIGQNALFSDGCSTISPVLARDVSRKISRNKEIPSCFQFRLGGAKGVLFQDPQLEGKVLCLRPSQTKFESPALNLDITLTSSRPLALFLNRPLIALLEHHGVPESSFTYLQDTAIKDTQRIRGSLVEAATIFGQHGLGSSFQLESLFKNIAQILRLELTPSVADLDDGNVQLAILKISIAHGITHILRQIKHRAHIRVPDSYTLLGVCDEWDCLEEGEVFAQVYDPRTRQTVPIEGRLIITRSPQIHPGDVQFVRAVWRPELEHLKNVVVFSCKGDRSLPSMLGGGDLDGDIYNLILNTDLHPPKPFTAEPGEYKPLLPTLTPHLCGITDVVDFIVNYIKSDLVGYISTLHLRISDINGLSCGDCLRLAEAASHAVDFPKVGTAVDFKTLPKAPDGPRPDYMSGEGYRPRPGDDRYYPSRKILGKLFRSVPKDEYEPEEEDWTNPLDFRRIDGRLILAVRRCLRRLRTGRFGANSATLNMEQPDEVIDDMHHVFEDYREQLLHIAKTHTNSTKPDVWLDEAEMVTGAIMEHYPDPRKRREASVSLNLQTQELARKIRLEFAYQETDVENWNEEYFDALDYEEDPDVERLCNIFNRARAAWIASEEIMDQDVEMFGVQSFAMIALGSMLNAIKALERL
ncbi:hypothetical protein D9757_012315 [Collybiopsis confluens]|uniref:RNA-dependent RNA polymerase n=1 Tax=Collybiopsis confluens TaxID=2823264 RepID=A0A8H5GAA5_9AGAR|nr:hypothetical protein D9757_012315 [Collybiopsis confluens]